VNTFFQLFKFQLTFVAGVYANCIAFDDFLYKYAQKFNSKGIEAIICPTFQGSKIYFIISGTNLIIYTSHIAKSKIINSEHVIGNLLRFHSMGNFCVIRIDNSSITRSCDSYLKTFHCFIS